MPFSAETLFRFPGPVAGAALAVMLSIGLGGCGGGGSGGGEQVMIVPDSQTQEPVPPPPPRESPDLVVESPSVSDPAPSAGAGFTLSVSVRNAGSGAAPAAKVRFYRSADAAITTSDEEVGVSSVAELAVSGVGAASVELTAPQAPGTYYYGACVAVVSGESDTANNCSASVRVAAPAPRIPALQAPPDLVVESPSSSDSNPLPGTDFTFSATVRNAGGRAAPATTARFYRSADAAITTSDTEAGSTAVAGLAPSGSVAASKVLTALQTPGTYYYGACVTAVSGESDTANNCSASVRITVPKPPDLVVTSPSASPDGPTAGGAFSLKVKLSNSGKSVRPIWLRYYRSDDATFTASDPQVGSYRVRGEPDSHGHFYPVKALDAPADSGVYYYRACADAAEGESNTANNCSPALKVEVAPERPNLVIASTSVSERKGGSPDGRFRLSVAIWNLGGPAPATTVRFYDSTDTTFTSSDTEVGSVAVPALGKIGSQTNAWFQSSLGGLVYVTPPSSGTHHYGACVDPVPDESSTADNCDIIHTIRK